VGGIEHFERLRDDGLPGIVFSAHLGNWELPAICAARFGLDTTAIFRPPNDPAAARLVYEVRSGTMGGLAASSGSGAAFAIAGVLDRGGHLGQLIDQHFTRGVVTSFLGRPALTNPLLAKLARHHDCPVTACGWSGSTATASASSSRRRSTCPGTRRAGSTSRARRRP
jgi:KDO2-lipid IV(A) lauroyltransferase